jgi:hypothetical protein
VSWNRITCEAPAALGGNRSWTGRNGNRIQKKQGGHHYPPRPEDGPPMDDTDRNTDKIIKPSRLPKAGD